MKKIIIAFAALAAAFSLVSCSKEQAEATSTDLKLNIKVANLDGSADTKAVKTGWESGDKINIWYEGNAQRNPDLVIKYDGSEWKKDESATVSGNKPAASGSIFYAYEGGNDLSKYTGSENTYYGINLIYGDNYYKHTPYTYTDGTFSTNIENWTPATEFQVVVTDIDPAKYELKCSNLMQILGFGVAGKSLYTANVGYDKYVPGVANEDGAAFYYKTAKDRTATASYVFTLKNTETNEEMTYTVTGKTHMQGTFTAIKIDYSKFQAESDYESVDLGLSVKWATMNVGATKPEDYGYYFAWGETMEKTNYNWAKEGDYKWGIYDSSASPKYGMTKYTADVEGGDGLKTLQPGDDPATVNWGSKWRTPTFDEIKELLDNTKCEWTWDATKKGYTVKGLKTGNSIFLPASGSRYGLYLDDAGAVGFYWSSSVDDSGPSRAYYFSFYSNGHFWNNDYRCYGQSVRAVTE